MNNLNTILVEGNLTRDPEVKYTAKGTALCTLSLAVNRSYRSGDAKQEEVSFFDVQTWGKLAERCGEYLAKGRGARVIGRLKQDRWQNQEGQNRSKVIIVAEQVEFMPDRRSGPAAPEEEPDDHADEVEAKQKGFDEFEDDVPF